MIRCGSFSSSGMRLTAPVGAHSSTSPKTPGRAPASSMKHSSTKSLMFCSLVNSTISFMSSGSTSLPVGLLGLQIKTALGLFTSMAVKMSLVRVKPVSSFMFQWRTFVPVLLKAISYSENVGAAIKADANLEVEA